MKKARELASSGFEIKKRMKPKSKSKLLMVLAQYWVEQGHRVLVAYPFLNVEMWKSKEKEGKE